jgi:hypothetical protein
LWHKPRRHSFPERLSLNSDTHSAHSASILEVESDQWKGDNF